jgi:ubiquinone/menaquinone biosynthesis C-methylase UbiE
MTFYNQIASHYDVDSYHLISDAHVIALQQIERHVPSCINVLDLCVGTGSFIMKLAETLHFENFTGVDISGKMIEIAKGKIPFPWRPVEDNAINVLEHVQEGSQDLILCHFLFDYVSPEILIPACMKMLKPGGYLSLATSTKQIFDEAFYKKIDKHKFLSRFFDIRSNIAKSPNVASHQVLVNMLHQHQFQIQDGREYFNPVEMKNGSEFWHLLHDSGWMGGFFSSQSKRSVKLIKWGAHLFEFPVISIYPMTVNFHFSLILAQKN